LEESKKGIFITHLDLGNNKINSEGMDFLA
jgi:hypothetical protein